MIIFTDTITRRRGTLKTDAHGDTFFDWSTSTDTLLSGVSVQPNAQSEDISQRRDLLITSWRVYSQPGTDLDVLPTDRMVLDDGTVCEVKGEIARWANPFTGGVHHVEFVVERIEG